LNEYVYLFRAAARPAANSAAANSAAPSAVFGTPNTGGKVAREKPATAAGATETHGVQRRQREESRHMTAEVRAALKRRRRHYSSGSMLLHQSLAKAQNMFDLLAMLSVRMIPLQIGDYRETWVDPMPFHDYQDCFRRDLMQVCFLR